MRKLYPALLVLAASARYQLASYAGEQWRVLLGSDVIEGIFEKLETARSSLVAKAALAADAVVNLDALRAR